MSDDRALLLMLHDMWEIVDPPPDDLVERVLFGLQLETLEFELLDVRDVLDPVGARGPETTKTITFGSDSLTVMVSLSAPGRQPRRLDGWIAPGASLRVEMRTNAGSRYTLADSDGRFAFDDTPAGLVQLILHPTPGATVELARPVITPAVHL